MDDRDRAFVSDMFQFSSLNRAVTVACYRKGLEDTEEVTCRAFGLLEPQKPEEIVQAEVKQYNQNARIQSILISRIFAELVAALEDFGALGFAVRNRHKNNLGIFRQYFKSSSADVATFFDTVLSLYPKDQAQTLALPNMADLLNLPTLENLATELPPDTFALMGSTYVSTAYNLYKAAEAYRAEMHYTNELSNEHPSISANWEDEINIITHITGVGKFETRTLTNAFNKIKHRFMVVEQLPSYTPVINQSGESQQEQEKVYYGVLGKDLKDVDAWIDQTVMTVKLMQEILSIIQILDQAGVQL